MLLEITILINLGEGENDKEEMGSPSYTFPTYIILYESYTPIKNKEQK